MAQSRNGIDLGAVYRRLTEVGETVRAHATRFDNVDRRLDQLLRVVDQHSRKLDDLSAGVTELRGAVGQFREAVISQGVRYSGLEDRVRRVERHLKFEPSSK